jgi:hypothetical protein
MFVTITNTGNSAAVGAMVLTLGPSIDGSTPVAGVTLAKITTRRSRLNAGKSIRYRLHFAVTKKSTAGTFHPYVSLSFAGINQTSVGGATFVVI